MIPSLLSAYHLGVVLDVYEALVLIDAAFVGSIKNISTTDTRVRYTLMTPSSRTQRKIEQYVRVLCAHISLRNYTPTYAHRPTHSLLEIHVGEKMCVEALRPRASGTYGGLPEFSMYYLDDLSRFLREQCRVHDTRHALWRNFAIHVNAHPL